MPEIEYADRYGGRANWPDPATMCKGQCEGTGVVPIKGNIGRPGGGVECVLPVDHELMRRWQAMEEAEHAPDGWHFVVCPTCDGGGLRVKAK